MNRVGSTAGRREMGRGAGGWCPTVVRVAAAVAVQVATVPAAGAHDFWIQPLTYRPPAPSVLGIALRVGEQFGAGDPYPRNPTHALSFVIAGPNGTAPVVGATGADPAGTAVIAIPGVYVIGYRSTRTVVELDAATFEHHLAAERLDEIAILRLARGQQAAPAREAFSRCAKALVEVGDGAERGADHVLEHTLELVPDRRPAVLRPGEDLSVRLLYEGTPVPNALVTAINAAVPSARVERRTDAQGRAWLPLASDGLWLLRSVRMYPAPPGLGVDWESVWASLTFVVPPS